MLLCDTFLASSRSFWQVPPPAVATTRKKQTLWLILAALRHAIQSHDRLEFHRPLSRTRPGICNAALSSSRLCYKCAPKLLEYNVYPAPIRYVRDVPCACHVESWVPMQCRLDVPQPRCSGVGVKIPTPLHDVRKTLTNKKWRRAGSFSWPIRSSVCKAEASDAATDYSLTVLGPPGTEQIVTGLESGGFEFLPQWLGKRPVRYLDPSFRDAPQKSDLLKPEGSSGWSSGGRTVDTVHISVDWCLLVLWVPTYGRLWFV